MSKPRITQTAIIGGGLAGLITAAALEKAGQDYLIIEAQGDFGGLVKGAQEHGIWLDYGLKSVPAGDELSSNPLIRLRDLFELNLPIESWKDAPQTHDTKNGFTEFVGFGEIKARELIEELGYYLKTPRLLVSGGWKTVTDQLIKLIPESKRMTRSIVTKLDVSEGSVTALWINAETQVSAQRYVFTLPPQNLKSLLPTGTLGGRLLQKIAKTEPFTTVSLDIAAREKVTEAKNIFILKDTVEHDFYVLGQFISNTDPMRQTGGLQLSTWMTLLTPEAALDDENVSKAIRTMKKVIKKVYPSLIDQEQWERLIVVPEALGQFDQFQLEDDDSVPGVHNLFVAGAQTKGINRNLSNALDSALRLGKLLSVAPVNSKERIADENLVQTELPQSP